MERLEEVQTMNEAMKIFTVAGGKVQDGAVVERFTLQGAGVTIPAVLVGETGRGRKLGVLPVDLLPHQRQEWEEKGKVIIYSAKIGQTKSGRPKLIATEAHDTVDHILVVLRTPIGFRGSNSHTGDRVEEYWTLDSWYKESATKAGIPIKDRYTADEVREYSPRIMKTHYGKDEEYVWDAGFNRQLKFAPFPGEILVEGVIAQGDAGRMGSGHQYVAIIPKGVVFRTGYSGRLYGKPAAHYYLWDGERLLAATWEERQVSDLF